MNNLEHYMSLPYPIEIIPDEGGVVAMIPDLPGCMSSGETIEEAVQGLQDAKELWVQGKLEDQQPIPEPTSVDEYSGKFVLRVPKSLHRTLDLEARKQGTSLNQYLVHLLSERSAAKSFDRRLQEVISASMETELSKVWSRCTVHNHRDCNVLYFEMTSEPNRGWGREHLKGLEIGPEVVFGASGHEIVPMIEYAPTVPAKVTKIYRLTDQASYRLTDQAQKNAWDY